MQACLWECKSELIYSDHLHIKAHFFKIQNRSNFIAHFIHPISLQIMFINFQKLGLSWKKEDWHYLRYFKQFATEVCILLSKTAIGTMSVWLPQSFFFK